MNRIVRTLIAGIGLALAVPSSASVYRLKETVPHAGHPATPQLTALDSVIVLDSDTPESLKVMGLRFDMTRKYSSRKTGEKSWTEYYSVPEYGYRVGLEKDTERGVTAILLRDRNKNLFRYVPEDAPVPVSYVPPILVRKAGFEYFDKRNTPIGGWEEPPEADRVKKLEMYLEYQSFAADSTMLYVRITDRSGNTRQGRSGWSYTFPLKVQKATASEISYAGHWKKKLHKYDRLEIYDPQGRQLLCTPIPIKGTTIPVPIFSRCICPVCQSRPRKRRDDPHRYSYYMTLYIKGTIGSHIPGRGVLEGWREQEVE